MTDKEKQWLDDPRSESIFGFLPLHHASWFYENSGTKWISKQKKWIVDGNDIIRVVENKTKFGVIKSNYYKANKFQDDKDNAKRIIIETMNNEGTFLIDNNDIYNLMRNKTIELEYEYQGEKYKKIINM